MIYVALRERFCRLKLRFILKLTKNDYLHKAYNLGVSKVSVVVKIVSVAIIMIVVGGIMLSSLNIPAYAQANATTSANQTGKAITTSTPSQQASHSIRGAITSTGEFAQKATQKIAGSKSAQTIVNESSDVLGNATVETKRFFSPK